MDLQSDAKGMSPPFPDQVTEIPGHTLFEIRFG